jgi:hypothetical protein
MANAQSKLKAIRFNIIGDVLDDCKAVVTSSAQLIDSAIIGALAFFTTLGATSVAAIPTVTGLTVAGIASGTEFFMVLAIKRGVLKPQVAEPT